MSKVDLSRLTKSWPSPIIPRTEVGRFTGGTITPAFLANLDSQGLGPPVGLSAAEKLSIRLILSSNG